MKIIYSNGEGGVSIICPEPAYLAGLTGTDEEKHIYIANTHLPTGTPYEIISDLDYPADKSGRDSWTYSSGDNERVSEDV